MVTTMASRALYEQKSVNFQDSRCKGCEYCYGVTADAGFNFFGCYCKPFKGKWVVEIKDKDCPMGRKHKEGE